MTQESVERGTTRGVPPHPALLQLLFGKHISYSISAMARLGVADQMGDEPVSVDWLAGRVGGETSALNRVMRMLAGTGLFEELDGERFRLTSLGKLLRTDAPGSLRAFAIQLGDPWSTRPWEHFTETVRTGMNGVRQAFGKDVWELFLDEPEQAANFNRSMTGLSEMMLEPILRAYDFSPILRVADIGGGHGRLVSALLKNHSRMRGLVYDLPEVVAGAAGQPHLADCQGRIEFEAGSFFERVPGGCDAYLLKFILHDWSDDHCRNILRCIRQQLPRHGRVLVSEQIVDSHPELSLAKLLDIEMLALTVGGRERTEAEFAALFQSAGLRLNQVFPSESPVCVLEAYPA